MKKILLIVIPLAILVIAVIKLKSNKEIAQKRVFQYDKQTPVYVDADTARMQPIDNELVFSGTFDPNKETKLSAEMQGKINQILVDAGSFVTKGQALVQLDNSLLKLQLQNADVQIEGLEADVKRYSVLTEADAVQGVQLEKVQLALKSAKVQKATLQEQINKTIITAPFDGIITSKLSEEGSFAAPGLPLLQLTDISSLKFTINIAENDLQQFQTNHTYPVKIDAFPEINLSGKIILIGSKANTGSSFPVQFIVNNTKDLKIKSGMFGKVLIKSENEKKGIVIPQSAVTGTADNTQLYIIKNGKAVQTKVVISQKIKNMVIISKGLQENDVFVTSGFINLFDGANVKLK